MSEEIFDLVNEDGEVIGQAPRSECHGNPDLLHQVAHVLVFNTHGDLLLQLRAKNKDIQPDKWDTSVGGHLNPGENPLDAAHREMKEELGIETELTFLYRYIWRSEVESELVSTYTGTYEGAVDFDPGEIQRVAYWSADKINDALGSGDLTGNFELEWEKYQSLKQAGD